MQQLILGRGCSSAYSCRKPIVGRANISDSQNLELLKSRPFDQHCPMFEASAMVRSQACKRGKIGNRVNGKEEQTILTSRSISEEGHKPLLVVVQAKTKLADHYGF